MLRIRSLGAGAALILLVAGCASAPLQYSGGVLVNSAGMTLYTFDKDPAGSGKSVCNDKCAVNWPPLKTAADDKPSGDYSIIARDDGSKQWAYKGQPLYLWIKDQKPGDRTGDGLGNAWRAVREDVRPMAGSGGGGGY